MRFDMSRAWTDAMGRIGGNREMMMVVAGVFFLLPSLLFYILYSDVQAQAIADLQQLMAGKAPSGSQEAPAGYGVVALALVLVQLVGSVTLTILLDDRQRPTVGEAIRSGFTNLPTLIGAGILVFLGMLVIALFGAVLVGLVGAIGTGMVGMTLVGIPMLVLVAFFFTRLSLLVPVVALEYQRNPIAALRRSWQLVKGNTMLLFLFFLLLGIVYSVISLLMLPLMALLVGIIDGGLGMFLAGLVSSIVSAAANVVFIAVVVAAHRQLSGSSRGDFEETFR